MSDMHTLTVPARFWDDHDARDLVQFSGLNYVKSRSAKGVTVVLHSADVWDLYDDAVYYSDAVKDMGSEYLGLQASARGTVTRLDKAFTPDQIKAFQKAVPK